MVFFVSTKNLVQKCENSIMAFSEAEETELGFVEIARWCFGKVVKIGSGFLEIARCRFG